MAKINEISKKLAGNYVKKAAKSVEGITRSSTEQDTSYVRSRKDLPQKTLRRKLKNRHSGIGKAVDRLTKEEQLAELSRNTLSNYVKKAAKDIDNRAHQQGRDYEDTRKWEFANSKATEKKYEKTAQKYFKTSDKIDRRHKGIQRATDRLTKEEQLAVKTMNEDLDDLIKSIVTDNAVDAKQVFDNLVTQKVADRVDQYSHEVAQDMFEDGEDEEDNVDTEEEDEIDISDLSDEDLEYLESLSAEELEDLLANIPEDGEEEVVDDAEGEEEETPDESEEE
jgi:hypothetical protein